MYLDYSKLEFDSNGRPETPELELQTLGGDVIGILAGVANLKMNIKFSEPSEISFDIPAVVGEEPNPFYDMATGHKIIYTKHYGIYKTMNPENDADGISDVKHISGYSLEKTLETKKFFIEDGTFNFWNPADPADTVIGRILEIAADWSVGYISPALIGRYRTFDSFDDYLLSFIYNEAPDRYRCVFVFDPYEMTINAYDADEERPALPIYLDFDNLMETIDIQEISDELVTAIRPYGSDSLDIRAVNPIGTNWMYDLSYFISNNDIPRPLAEKWQAWQQSIINNRMHYEGLISLRSSATARILTEQAKLTDLQGQLDDLTNQQSVTIQALALETTAEGKASQQAILDEINKKLETKKAEIATQEGLIESIEEESEGDGLNSYKSQITAIINELAIDKFFTSEELSILSRYFIEQDFTDETFVATDLDVAASGDSYSLANGTISVNGTYITEVDMTDDIGKTMYVIKGGAFALSGDKSVSADIIRGTVEVNKNGQFVVGIYVGKITVNGKSLSNGTITLTGTLSNMSNDIHAVVEREVTTYKGTWLKFSVHSGFMYLTANVSDYQKYSVQMELYDYAAKVLADISTPTYEFSVESGNFLFSREFEPFRKKLELGKGVYLNTRGTKLITPLIIEFELDFEDLDNFSIVFSNRFKRHDNVNTLKDMIEKSYSASRSFDANKYIYNQSVGQSSAVSKFMSSSLNAAVNAVIGAANQSVLINGAGIQIGGASKYKMRIVDSMIAMTDDDWNTAKMAIGRFASPEIGEYWGVNAEVIGGKLFVGNNLIIENENDLGIMQFKVDSTGAWLNNATFILQSDTSTGTAGGKIILDPRYGIVAGNSGLFDVNGTAITPSFIGDNGSIELDEDGIPTNANFYLDIRDGSAYFRGTVNAASGDIGGWELAEDNLHSGSATTYVALNSSKTNNPAYAIWAGANDPASAPFWVKRNGDLYARNGTFQGTISGARYLDSNGNSMMNSSEQFTSGYLDLKGIVVRNSAGQITFQVDSNGNVSVSGNIIMGSGSTINWATVGETNVVYSQSYQLANQANSAATIAQSTASTAITNATTALNSVQLLANGEYYSGTFINGHRIYSPELIGDQIILSTAGRYTVGVISLQQSSTYAFDITSYMSLRMQSAAGYNTYVSNGYSSGDLSAYIGMFNTGRLALNGNHITINSANYGSSLPAGKFVGQIFFLLD